METIAQDFRLAVRLLRKSPGFTLVALVTLALGIGANTAIFSVVDGVLLRPSPFRAIDRLVMVWETDRNSSTIREPASVPDFLDVDARRKTLDDVAAFMGEEVNLTLPAGEPVRLAALRTSHRLFGMVGLRPSVGRAFAAAEDRVGGPRVALISESLWERSFGRDPTIVGQTLRLDEVPHTIVGVVPPQADFGVLQILSAAEYSRSFADRGDRTRVDVWLPLQPDPQALPRETHPIFVLGRLVPGGSIAAAQEELAAIAADLERTYAVNVARGVFVEPITDVVFGPVRPVLYVLLGAVALVLLVACVNVANLLLARGASRTREIAVRRALGAGDGRLARQFFVENLVLTTVAAVAGVALAVLGVRALLALAPADVPRLDEVRIDVRVLTVTLVVSVLVGVVFGMVPTLQARRVDLQGTLKTEGGPQTSVAHGRLRAALVVSELAFTVMLAIGAALLIESLWRLQQVDPGFRSEGVLKAEYQLPPSRYPVDFKVFPNFKEMHAFTGALLQRAAALPGVVSVAVAGNHPLDPGFTNSFRVVGREAEGRTWPEISVRRVTPGYFRTVGLALVRGRLLQDSDSTTAPAAALINAAAARRFFASRDPIGAQIRLWGAARTIVGIVANEKFQGLAEAPPIAVYLPLAQAPSANGAGALMVRASGNPLALAPALRGVFREIDAGLAVYGIEALDETVSRSLSQRRFAMVLLAVFAALALTLGAVGIHGVLSYSVTQRTKEIGIRLALGAQPASLRRRVVADGIALALVGLGLGLAGAFALRRVLASLLFGVTPTDPIAFTLVPILLLCVAAWASDFPARRATRVDPAVALRE